MVQSSHEKLPAMRGTVRRAFAGAAARGTGPTQAVLSSLRDIHLELGRHRQFNWGFVTSRDDPPTLLH